MNRNRAMKVVEIDGKSDKPFDCPYCGKEIETHDTAQQTANWEIISFPSWGEIDRMDCPHCRKRFELHQKC